MGVGVGGSCECWKGLCLDKLVVDLGERRAVGAVKDLRCHPGLSSTVPVRRARSGCKGKNLPSHRSLSRVSVNG